METKEEREARLHALEVEQQLEDIKKRQGWSVDPKLNKQLAEMGTWVTAVDDLVDSIKVNCKPKDMKRKQNGDEYTVPEHKHLKKLIALEDRIDRWKQVGPAVTEHEWEMANNDLDWVTEWRRNCSKDANLRIPKAFLIRMNKIWKKYATKADKLITKIEK